jgi:signal transduction histidine kinase
MTSMLPLAFDRCQAWERDNKEMLRAAMATVRSVLFFLAGFLTFISPWPGAADSAAEIIAYAVAGIALGLWGLTSISPALRDRFRHVLPWALAACAASSGVASALPGAGNLIALSVLAVIAAGSGVSLVTGWVVAVAGAVAAEAAGQAVGTGYWATVEYPSFLLVGLLVAFTRRAHRVRAEQAAALTVRSEQLRVEQARTAALDERARIAREIHDVLAHSLGALGLQIQLAQAVLADQHDEARVVQLLEQARLMAVDGLAEWRGSGSCAATRRRPGSPPGRPRARAESGARTNDRDSGADGTRRGRPARGSSVRRGSGPVAAGVQ